MKYLPCPFCGTWDPEFEKGGFIVPTPIVNLDEDGDTRYVECEKCGARGPIDEDHHAAKALWNSRKG